MLTFNIQLHACFQHTVITIPVQSSIESFEIDTHIGCNIKDGKLNAILKGDMSLSLPGENKLQELLV